MLSCHCYMIFFWFQLELDLLPICLIFISLSQYSDSFLNEEMIQGPHNSNFSSPGRMVYSLGPKNLHYSGTPFSISSCWIACLMLSCLVEHSISSFLMKILEAKYYFLSWLKLPLFLFPHLNDSFAGYKISCWKEFFFLQNLKLIALYCPLDSIYTFKNALPFNC